jgi:hypothetical protein
MNGQEGPAFSAQGDIITRVVTELAVTLGRDATDIAPLARTIDPDGLRLVVESAESCTVSFRHAGCTVRIQVTGGDPTVDVDRAPE